MKVEIIGGNNRTPQHLPIGSLKVFGSNPFDEPMFRVVWSESRFYLVGANHTEYEGDPSPDKVVKARQKDPNVVRQSVGYKWLPLYPGKPAWILEMWKSGMGFTGCTPEMYEITYRDPVTNLLTLGPYPTRGEYCQCHTFVGVPTFSEVADRINKTRAGWNYTYNDHLVANREVLEKREKAQFNRLQDIFLDSQQAFKNKPTNIRPGKRTKESIKLGKTAKQAGFRKTRPTFSTGRTPNAIRST